MDMGDNMSAFNFVQFKTVKESLSDTKKIKENLRSASSPADLKKNSQELKDISSRFIFDVKGVINKLDQVLKISNGSGIEVLDANKTAFNQAQKVEIALEKRIKEMGLNESVESIFFIDEIPIDFLYNPTPFYSTNTISQSIVTNRVYDVLSEDAENKNMTLSASIIFEGADKETRYKKVLKLRDEKKVIRCIFDQVYENMLITSLTAEKDGNLKEVRIDIAFEQIFFASVQDTEKPINSFKQPLQSRSSMGKTGSI